ncbi:hypothetical protein BDV96DRAFT_607511 [Lophiotrema nucula]|uniref:Uncharacterized protein n=1 Tax=Lophiotrema nucula TaxID=690887 RepID=A0A6A5YG72_9PLEO|nr:hypothetical protein BDV96DRAFT_607511 [Lophiotrema nucula]
MSIFSSWNLQLNLWSMQKGAIGATEIEAFMHISEAEEDRRSWRAKRAHAHQITAHLPHGSLKVSSGINSGLVIQRTGISLGKRTDTLMVISTLMQALPSRATRPKVTASDIGPGRRVESRLDTVESAYRISDKDLDMFRRKKQHVKDHIEVSLGEAMPVVILAP